MDTYRVLLRHLETEGQVLNVSNNFSLLETNCHRVNFAYDLLKKYEFLPGITTDVKNNSLCVDFRQKGNDMFKQRQARNAIEFYTKSVANGENSSANLAVAFSNRSAVLFECGLYRECLKDIEYSLANKNCPDNIKSKLETRKGKAENMLEEQVKIELSTPAPQFLKEDQNPLIECANNALKIAFTEDLGRHIIASREIEPGEILAVEEPFCQILIDQFYTTCHHCLKVCYNLIPCTKCTHTLYCSEKCEKNGYSYHQFECPIVATLRIIEMDKLKLLPLRISLLVKNMYGDLDGLKSRDAEPYLSNRYAEIHNLVANTELRSVADLFERAVFAAVIFHLVKNYTSFFKNDLDDHTTEDVFKELLLLHMQTGPCNFHEISLTKNLLLNNTLEITEIGAGAFSFLSMFNHSCSPNVTRVCYGSSVAVVALETIQRGQQCFDNYGYHHALMSKEERQKHLKAQYFFDCQCEACLKNFPLYQDMITTNQDEIVTLEEINKLQQGDYSEAKKIFEKMVEKLKEISLLPKPNKTLSELQEVLKQCYFIFSSVRTPI